MPARSARSSRTAASSSRRKPREPSASETPDPGPAVAAQPEPSVEPYGPLQTAVAGIFLQAQKTTAGHRKLVINLRAIFDQCLSGTGPVGSTIGVNGRKGEKLFAQVFFRFLNRALVVKKSEVVGDRCLRVADMFVRNLVQDPEKAKKTATKEKDAQSDVEMEDEQDEAFVETSATRVVLRLLNHLETIMTSKEKVVRYRTTQLLVLLLNSLQEFPFDYSSVSNSIFQKICAGLQHRIQDKESMVRVQAAIGLVKLMEMGVTPPPNDDEDSDEESEQNGIVGALIDAMQNDPSADVRRAVLFNLSPTPATLPYLLERSRDTDHAARRSVFTRLLPSMGDFRHLTIGMREKLLRWGLNDRDESVRAEARKMFNFRWVEDANGDLLEVLERLDISSEGIDGGAKDLALKGFWEERKDVFDEISFDEDYWNSLTPESAFLVRSFNDFCRSGKTERADADDKMPEVSQLAFYLQNYLNKLVFALRNKEDGEVAATEGANLEFVVQQLLLIAGSMDYGDEIGRRKMFALLRESLSISELSETITKLVVGCLSKLSMGEGDFCMLILEVIAEVHDTIAPEPESPNDDDSEASFHSAASEVEDSITVTGGRPRNAGDEPHPKKRKTSDSKSSNSKKAEASQDTDMMDVDEEHAEEKALKELVVNLKCLHIAQCMLENVSGSLKSNTHLVSMLNGLVVPAVRSHEAPVRELGLRCLGLSCLLDRTLAEENLTLFAHCFNRGHESLQIQALHIISDILLCHGAGIFESETCSVDQRTLYKMFAKSLKLEDQWEDMDSVQAITAEVVCKLMLAQVIQDEELLKALVVSYFSPITSPNPSLRQTLSYFLPVYCHSSTANQARMTSITMPVLHALLVLHADTLPGEMISPTAIASQLADWTDPRKNVSQTLRAAGSATATAADPSLHVTLAIAALDRCATSGCTRDEKKLLFSLLSKLHLPKDADPARLRELYEIAAEAIEKKVAPDALTRNALNKLEVTLGKIVGELELANETVMPERDGDGDGEDEDDGEEDAEADADEGEGDKTVTAVTSTMDPPVPAEDGEEKGDDDGVRSESERTPAVTDDESE